MIEKRELPYKKIKLCIGALLSLLLSAVQAQTVYVRGKVIDIQGDAIGLVSVRVKGQSAMALTNIKGEYGLECQSTDSVLLSYSLIGYDTQRRLLLNPADTLTINITLHEKSLELTEALVAGQRIQTGQTQTIRKEDTKLAPSATGNAVEELIAKQAGVSTHNELSSQYNVRGGSFDENSVYLNGIEIFRPMLVNSGQQEGLSVINSHMVEQINFSSGGFEPKYGERMSSVLDITYKKVDRFETNLSGSLLGGGAYVGFGNKTFSMLSSVRYKSNAYLLGSLDTKGEYKPRFWDYQTYLSWRPNKRWTIDLIGNISDNTYQFTPQDRETKFGTLNDAKTFKVYFDGQEKDYFRTYFGAFTLQHHFSSRTSLAFIASTFLTKEQLTYDIQGQYWLNDTQTKESLGVGTYMEHARDYLQARVLNWGLRLNTTWGSHRLQAGLNLKTEEMRENSREWEMRDSVGYSLPHNAERLDLIYSMRSDNRMSSKRFELYAQDTYRLATDMGSFTFNYGVRLSRWSWNKETLISPRFSVGYLPVANPNLTLRFATGVYYQAPFYKELRDTTTVGTLTTVSLNKDIKSPRSLHFVLGGDYTFNVNGRPYKFTSELYYKYLTNLIPYTVDNLRIVYSGQNQTDGYAAGIDFKLYGEFVPGTNSWLTFSLMSTKQKLGNKWVPLPTDQRYNFSAYFTDYFPGTDRWLLSLKAAFADGLPFGAPHSGAAGQVFRAPAYKRVDLGLSYRLLNNEDRHVTRGFAGVLRNAWLGIDCFNVFGLNNVSSYYWVTDITNNQFAVPNYLTGRQVNLRFLLEF